MNGGKIMQVAAGLVLTVLVMVSAPSLVYGQLSRAHWKPEKVDKGCEITLGEIPHPLYEFPSVEEMEFLGEVKISPDDGWAERPPLGWDANVLVPNPEAPTSPCFTLAIVKQKPQKTDELRRAYRYRLPAKEGEKEGVYYFLL